MSPEQLRGEEVDARTDQYCFCVALHEALFGARPARATAEGAPAQRAPLGNRAASGRRVPAGAVQGDRARAARGARPALALDVRAAPGALPRRAAVDAAPLAVVLTLGVLALGLWGRHLYVAHRAKALLEEAAARVPVLVARHRELSTLRLRHPAIRAILDAFESASDLDAALGLASSASQAHSWRTRTS